MSRRLRRVKVGRLEVVDLRAYERKHCLNAFKFLAARGSSVPLRLGNVPIVELDE